MRLDDPEVVRREYADESRFTVRQAVWRWATGPDAHDLVLEALAEVAPRSVLEVGSGKGELAERIARELDVSVTALDQSERMVELARTRGLDAVVGDVQALPFADADFDAAVAAWMLYHVADLDRGVSELARVLAPAGRLVAVTNSESNLSELWSLVEAGRRRDHPFSRENGARTLSRHFRRVEQHDVDGELTFPDHAAARRYVASSPTRAHLAERLPPFDGPLVACRRITVFVADK